MSTDTDAAAAALALRVVVTLAGRSGYLVLRTVGDRVELLVLGRQRQTRNRVKLTRSSARALIIGLRRLGIELLDEPSTSASTAADDEVAAPPEPIDDAEVMPGEPWAYLPGVPARRRHLTAPPKRGQP